MSDMEGTKATALMDWARSTGRACVLMDYSGCGRSEGVFAEGSIRRWAADALAVADALAPGPLLLVGSSMGGWIMLHLAAMAGARVAAMVGIAAAPDFTRWGLELDESDRAALAADGFVTRPSAYQDSPYRYHRALIEDGPGACVLDGTLAFDGPVRLLHGEADADVPWTVSHRLMTAVSSADVQLVLVKGGDHRLSSAADLKLLFATIGGLFG
jgi:pimeloyl-ACP methyl ester carboxylesterase